MTSSRYPHKNASTFNPFDSGVESQKSLNENQKQAKKDKQEFYKNQLDQHMYENPKSASGSNRDQEYSYGQIGDQRKQPQQRVGPGRSQPSSNNDTEYGIFGQQNSGYEGSDLDKKKRLQEEMTRANQRQIQEKEAQKKMDKARELESDKQRVQEASYQYENDNHQQREKNRRLVEENSRQVQQQRKEYGTRNQAKDQDFTPSSYISSQQSKPLSSKTNQQHYDQGYDQVASSMGSLDIKGRNTSQSQSQSQKHGGDMRGILQQGFVSDQQMLRENTLDSQPRSQNDYQKNKDKIKYGGSYNIITNDMR